MDTAEIIEAIDSAKFERIAELIEIRQVLDARYEAMMTDLMTQASAYNGKVRKRRNSVAKEPE